MSFGQKQINFDSLKNSLKNSFNELLEKKTKGINRFIV